MPRLAPVIKNVFGMILGLIYDNSRINGGREKFRGSSVQNVQVDNWYNQGQMTSDPTTKFFTAIKPFMTPINFTGVFIDTHGVPIAMHLKTP